MKNCIFIILGNLCRLPHFVFKLKVSEVEFINIKDLPNKSMLGFLFFKKKIHILLI